MKTWWTFEELQAYLGHSRFESTEVWCTRHGIRAVRHYRVADVLRERPPSAYTGAHAQETSTKDGDARPR